jgi:hypothetical protein
VSALIVDAVVRDDDVHVVDPFYKTKRIRAAKRWGNGTALKLRLEPEEEAYTYGDIKHYWGHIVQPFCDWTGYHKHEAHLMLKVECMPEGKTSITELSRDEFRNYIEAAEQTAREWCPEAFAIMEPRAGVH